MNRRIGTRVVVGIMLAAALVAVQAASAASLRGVRTGTISTYMGLPKPVIPGVIFDEFIDVNGTTLSRHLSNTGQTWNQRAGVFRIVDNQIGTSSGFAYATISTAWANVRVGVEVPAGIGSANPAAVINAGGAGAFQARIQPQTGGGWRIAFGASAANGQGFVARATTATYPGTYPGGRLVVTKVGAAVTVSFAGTVRLTHTLTGTDLTAIGAQTDHGLLTDGDGGRFDRFTLDPA